MIRPLTAGNLQRITRFSASRSLFCFFYLASLFYLSFIAKVSSMGLKQILLYSLSIFNCFPELVLLIDHFLCNYGNINIHTHVLLKSMPTQKYGIKKYLHFIIEYQSYFYSLNILHNSFHINT